MERQSRLFCLACALCFLGLLLTAIEVLRTNSSGGIEMNLSLDLVQLAPRENWIELYKRYNAALVVMNVSLVHPAPQESLWIELYDKNTLVSFKSIIISAWLKHTYWPYMVGVYRC